MFRFGYIAKDIPREIVARYFNAFERFLILKDRYFINQQVILQIMNYDVDDRHVLGSCFETNNKEIVINLYPNSYSNPSTINFLRTIFHEMVHAEQICSGNLKFTDNDVLWCDKSVGEYTKDKKSPTSIDKEEYDNLPWEREACFRDDVMIMRFFNLPLYYFFLISFREPFQIINVYKKDFVDWIIDKIIEVLKRVQMIYKKYK